MKEKDIIKFLKENVEPINDSIYGSGYRATVYLTDGTYLPCVMFRNPGRLISLALKRFKEEMPDVSQQSKSGLGYYNIVKSFVTRGNCINYYDIAKVETSRFAIPVAVLKQVKGETTMGWTGFVLKMKDGRCFSYGTQFSNEFFDIPEGYTGSDIIEVINHSYISKAGELKNHSVPFFDYPDDYERDKIFRECPFFECYIDSL